MIFPKGYSVSDEYTVVQRKMKGWGVFDNNHFPCAGQLIDG